MIDWDQFHFVRPAWLAAVPLIILGWAYARKSYRVANDFADVVAPHLSAALTVNHKKSLLWMPVDNVSILLLCLCAALAGPTWNRQLSPWHEETAPLVVALEVSDSMLNNDVSPNRLSRARFKILDILKERQGASTAIVVYGKSSHVLVPLTKDVEIVKPFLEALDPDVMPEGATRASSVFPLVTSLLEGSSRRGNLLFVNDGFAQSDHAQLAAFVVDSASPATLVLNVDPTASGVLPAHLDSFNMVVRQLTPDGQDVTALLSAMESRVDASAGNDTRWEEAGWWLIWPALALNLLWFRRGWSVP